MKRHLIKIVCLLSLINITAHAAATTACLQKTALDIVAPQSWLEQGMTRANFEFAEGVVKLTSYKATAAELEKVRKYYEINFRYGSLKALFVKSGEIFPELEDAEAMAIIDYTGGGYGSMNIPFRENIGIKNRDEITQLKIKVLASALNKVKNKFKGVAVRGATLESVDIDWLVDRMNKKLPIFSKAFWSSGRRSVGGFIRNVNFEIRSRTGIYVKEISQVAIEEEVLFNAGVPFRIDAIERSADDHNVTVKITELPIE